MKYDTMIFVGTKKKKDQTILVFMDDSFGLWEVEQKAYERLKEKSDGRPR